MIFEVFQIDLNISKILHFTVIKAGSRLKKGVIACFITGHFNNDFMVFGCSSKC